ncbi:MAG: DNA replication/repair protein RecF [Actinomycetota bacterium]|nr:DNA replication/repair protein RecF [Actinomycetota bacterium]MDA3004710.1 DNA replication/repair protein RecF [Actinomycetota bacterium]
MILQQIQLSDFRNYTNTQVDFATGVSAIIGANGQGKTNLTEALAYLSTMKSFRGVPTEAMIRTGTTTAFIRARVLHDDGREILIEARLTSQGRNQVLVNGTKLPKTRDLLGMVRTTVFSPDDLELVKGGPHVRREFLDDSLVALANKYDTLRLEVDRIVRQRNAVLKQSGGRINNAVTSMLDLWDEKFSDSGTQLGTARSELVAKLTPFIVHAYEELAQRPSNILIDYSPEWLKTGLAKCLVESRTEDLRRIVTTVGPHRDDFEILINNLPARTHASQGEQRTMALALRLALHRFIGQTVGEIPILILDDVLSELDPERAKALLNHFPVGQVLITTASDLPVEAHITRRVLIKAGTIISTPEKN